MDQLDRNIDQIIGRAELEAALADPKRKLRIKLGVDPTRPDIHIGHAVVLHKLRQFQDLGHTIIFLIGDATARIGDPSGKSKTRPVLTDDEILANSQTYLDQVGQILDRKKLEIRRNSEWWDKITFPELVALASNVSVAQLVERDDFHNRLETGQEIGLHEFLYPLMQAYDSYALEADVEFGGSDQLFNLLAGRSLQKKLGQAPQVVITCELLVGLDGEKKMSKSYDNYVAVTDPPTDAYGKIMSMPDSLIAPYYRLCTDIAEPVIEELVKTLAGGANPRDAKASLAREIVRIYHGEDKSLLAEETWNSQFREGLLPSDMPGHRLTIADLTAVELLQEVGFAASNAEAKRLIEQGGAHYLPGGGVAMEETMVLDRIYSFSSGDVIRAGKRRYVRLALP